MFIRNNIDPNHSLDEWLLAAGLDWKAESSPVIYKAGETAQVSKSHQVLFRSDKPNTVLGIHSQQYKPVQPRDIMSFADKFCQETGVTLHSAGTLQEGKKIWLAADTGGRVSFGGGDEIQNHLFFGTSFDGTTSTPIGPSAYRPVCRNTLMALMSSASMLRISHRSEVNWDRVRIWLKNEKVEFDHFGGLLQALHSIQVTPDQAVAFAKQVAAPSWDGKGKAPRALEKLVTTIANGQGQREAGSNAFGLIQGVSRFVDHDKQARSNDNRMNSAMFGTGGAMKTNAMDILIRDCVRSWGHESELQPVLADTKWEKMAA